MSITLRVLILAGVLVTGASSVAMAQQCGNGLIEGPYEECDDGNLVDADGCDSTCRPTGCGSGARTGDELCDDGNDDETDDCGNDCTLTVCGDGIPQTGCFRCSREPEECDDGNQVDGDGCDTTCRYTGCGSGVRTGSEECDDGNENQYDECLSDCRLNTCGDAEPYAAEECDDGNLDGGDGCSADCVMEVACGDVDEDGEVTVSDARRVLLHTTDDSTECPAPACDVDGNDVVDASDALITLRAALGLYDGFVCRSEIRVAFRLVSPVELVSLTIYVDYGSVGGQFIGDGEEVSCWNAIPSYARFDDGPDSRQLQIDWIASRSFTGPLDLGSCVFERYGADHLTFDVFAEGATPTLGTAPNVIVSAEVR